MLALMASCTIAAPAPDSAEAARALLSQGSYEDAIAAVEKSGDGTVEWRHIKSEALAATGRYQEQYDYLAKGTQHYPLDFQLKFSFYEAARRTGRTAQATSLLAELAKLVDTRDWAYRLPADRIALGRVSLLTGIDPKRVIETFYDPLRKSDPDFPGSYLATGQIALDKSDFALAARTFQAATRKFPGEAEAWLGLARAYATSDVQTSQSALEQALSLNPRLVGAHLLRAEHSIDSEDYPQAAESLDVASQVDPIRPEVHALRAVLAHLRGDESATQAAIAKALQPWPTNPLVPHLIGRKLSQKYRFAEGADFQRQALRFQHDYLPAKSQLASDLLRLGEDAEGWPLVAEVQGADPYDVVAFNLSNLHDVLKKFRTLTSDHFIVRMDPREADVYGPQVVQFLERAHGRLTGKYGITIPHRTVVEIFPDQKDFAIRTFGLPGGSGYLGVCFGKVITANSAAARPGSNASWEAILWHEFCHAVTLTMTRNRMPRWLSEGISVYEERQERAPWGEQMKPRYRAMILGADFTPFSQLSAAFLRPKSPVHLGFAYYESSLAVEWLIQRGGMEKMKALLASLAQGQDTAAALAVHYGPLPELDTAFAEYAKSLARQTGAQLDWSTPPPRQLTSDEGPRQILAEKPNHYAALLARSEQLLEARDWAEAEKLLRRLVELYPEQREPDGPYAMLARAQRALGDAAGELATLTRLASLSPDAVDAFTRLIEIHAGRNEWPQVRQYAGLSRAVDPMRAAPIRWQALAAEALGDSAAALSAWQALTLLEPTDLAEAHYHLARLLRASDRAGARRHLLLALEDSPRYREALAFLLELSGDAPPPPP